MNTSKHITKIILILLLILIQLNCGKEVSKSPVEPEPGNSKLVFNSNPRGSLIFLNGRNTGSYTPDSLSYIESGDYEITFKKKYYRDTSLFVSINDFQKTIVDIDYTQNPAMFGKLALHSNPSGASIKLNDSVFTSITPDTLENILPGEYLVTLKSPEHRDVVFSAIVQSSKITSISKTLPDTSVWVDYTVSNSGLISNNLSSVIIDQNGNKWIGSYDKGLVKFDDLSFTHYSETNSGIPSNRILTIAVDPQNNIWVGTDHGIGVYNGSSWQLINKYNSGLKGDDILSIKFDDNGNTWIGAYTGLFKFDGQNWVQYNDSLFSIWVNDLKIDSENSVWLATNSGIVKLKNNILEYYPDSVHNYPSSKVSAVEIDKNGLVWFGHQNYKTSRNGVSSFDGNSFTNYYIGSSSNSINKIFVDRLNNKWVSSQEGLSLILPNNSIFTYSKSNSLITSNNVTCVAIDENDVLWVATSGGGLNKFKYH